MKRYILFGIGAPVVTWLGVMTIGKKAGDVAGTAVFSGPGFLIQSQHGLLIETIAAGVLAAYLTKS